MFPFLITENNVILMIRDKGFSGGIVSPFRSVFHLRLDDQCTDEYTKRSYFLRKFG